MTSDATETDVGALRIRNSFCFILGVTIFLPFPTTWQALVAGACLVAVEFVVSFKVYSAGRVTFVSHHSFYETYTDKIYT